MFASKTIGICSITLMLFTKRASERLGVTGTIDCPYFVAVAVSANFEQVEQKCLTIGQKTFSLNFYFTYWNSRRSLSYQLAIVMMRVC